ncbi:MAG: hypothetical protein GPJ54_15560 [Candidatus Heimdallarchaeota archaeon]|nr:hypothetical protein [Candidatus Heimdallarchaeota archaeon]
MDSEFKIHSTHNLNLENEENQIKFQHFDRDNILEFTDKLQIHTDSEFFVIVLRGELTAIVHQDCISIRKSELIMIKPGFKSGFKIYKDEKDVEFFTITTPNKKNPIGIDTRFDIVKPLNLENQRELRREWGVRIPYKSDSFRKRWLFGYGEVPVRSDHVSLALVVVKTEEDFNLMFSAEYYHSHSKSYEYYVSIKGKDVLLVNGKMVSLSEGEVLVMPPDVCHIRVQMEFPFEGIVLRVPIISEDDKISCEITKVELRKNHSGEESDILYLDKGDEVIPQNRKTHYPGWTYCEHEGKGGWIPNNYMEQLPNNNFRMKSYYSSYELECGKGEIVEILFQESEWYFVKSEKGRVGWIPIEKTS